MITLKELRWSNAFSYGAENKVNFVNSPLIQLVGKNGHGKSSIALILEEVLFNKNSKNIKKADILNRYIDEKYYSIELDFEKDATEYTIKVKRSTTQTVKLYCGQDDISAHTATATYKLINDLIGIDHKTFTQIVYQSNASSLEFLTATDTNRKKFLIELLNLSKYSTAADIFKAVGTELSKEMSAAQAKVDTVGAWLTKYEKADLTEIPLLDEVIVDEEMLNNRGVVQEQLNSLDKLNKQIAQNNTYKELKNNIRVLPIIHKPEGDLTQLKGELAVLNKTVTDIDSFVAKMKKLSGTCPTCMSDIDTAQVESMISNKEAEKLEAQASLKSVRLSAQELETQLSSWQKYCKSQEDLEKYHSLIDEDMQEELLSKEELETELKELNARISDTRKRIQEVEAHNKAATANNAKISTILNQLQEFKTELDVYSAKLVELNDKYSIVTILNKTFSTNGLVAYKIECLVKDLEELTNEYLVDLSDGRFQISFKVSLSDKLNVVVTDNGKDIDILALSGGERARVNLATLLAIRKLMQSLSSSRINLLILDETIESLDVDGKEKLIEVLLKEENLNTFLISHGFSHPLLEKVNVVKEHNISRIES